MVFVGVLLGLCLLAAAVELGARLAHGMPLPFGKVPLSAHSRHPFFKDNAAIRYHPRLGWTLTPNMRAETHGLSTDAYGNRLPSSSPRDLPVGAIAACGNSFAAGSDVVDKDSWPALVEARVSIPVINASCGGWGADQVLMRADEMLTLARPRVLIVDLFGFDFQRAEFATYHYARKAYFVLSGSDLKLKDCPVPVFNDIPAPIIDHSYATYLVAQWIRRKRDIKPELYHRSSPETTGLEITKRLLARLKAKADRQGTRTVLLVQYAGNELRERKEQFDEVVSLLAHARSLAIEIVDTWAQWRGILHGDPAGFDALFTPGGHLWPAGNQLIADALSDQIERPAGQR
jgi:hypothetical protein